jgi:hypothetical protein
MTSNVYSENRVAIIAAMDEVIKMLPTTDNSPRKTKRDCLSKIRQLYNTEGGATEENFKLFVKTANIHLGLNMGGNTESLTIFKNTLIQKSVGIEIANERFKNLEAAKTAVDAKTQANQVATSEASAAPAVDDPLTTYRNARTALLDKAESDFSGLISEENSQKQEIVNQFKAFLNEEYPEPSEVGDALMLADHNELIKEFHKIKFQPVLKFPGLYGFLTTKANEESTFAKNLSKSFNSSSATLYGLYAGIRDLDSRPESLTIDPNSTPLEGSDDEAQSVRSASTSSNSSETSISSATSEGADTALEMTAEAKKSLAALLMMYDPQYATLKVPDGFQLSEDDIQSYQQAMQASIDAVSSIGSNQEDKKNILKEIKDLFDISTDPGERYRLIHMFMDVANKHRFSTFSFFASTETSSFKKFRERLESNNLWTKLSSAGNDTTSPQAPSLRNGDDEVKF